MESEMDQKVDGLLGKMPNEYCLSLIWMDIKEYRMFVVVVVD